MGILKATSMLPYRNLLPEDVAMNTFHFRTSGAEATVGEITTVVTAIDNFYFQVVGSDPDDSVAQFMSTFIRFQDTWTKLRLVPIDGSGAEIGSAIFVDMTNSTIPDPGDKNEPLEVCGCLSYQAVGGSSPSPRRRGRIYIGPLNTRCIEGGSGSVPPTIGVNFRNTVTGAAERLLSQSVAGAGSGGTAAPWGVFSKTDGDIFDIIGGYMDNATDTQRRRGVDEYVRSEWGFSS